MIGKTQNRVKQEMVIDGDNSIDDENGAMTHLTHQNDGNNSSDNKDNNADKEYAGPVVESTTLRQGKRVRKQAIYLVPTNKGQNYDQGVSFHQVSHLRVSEGEEIKGQFAGAGYDTKKGVLHFNFNEDAPYPTAMNEE